MKRTATFIVIMVVAFLAVANAVSADPISDPGQLAGFAVERHNVQEHTFLILSAVLQSDREVAPGGARYKLKLLAHGEGQPSFTYLAIVFEAQSGALKLEAFTRLN